MADYRFEKVDSNQFDSLIPLMRHCFGMEVNIEYFKWKFLDNPAGKFVGFAAIDEKRNETAAFFSVIPEEYVIDSKKRTIYQACEAMTHSNHRRKGLFEMPVNKCNDYLDKIIAEAGFEFVLYVDDNLYEASEYDREKANRLPRIKMIEESLEEMSLGVEMFHPKLREYARIFS